MEPVSLVCFKCKNFRKFEGGCKAFPDGIPEAITSGLNKHTKPLKGQGNDIVWQSNE